MGSLLVSNLPAGNVTTLMVGALVLALRTRAGPIVVGLAASLKVFPLLLVAGYVAERRWRAAAVATAVAGVLWLHVLAFGPRYVSDLRQRRLVLRRRDLALLAGAGGLAGRRGRGARH